MRPICGRKRATQSELSEFPSDIFGDSGAFCEERHELGSRDENFAVLAEFVLIVVLERVAADSVVTLKREREGFEFGMAARARIIGEALQSDRALGEAGLAGNRSSIN